MAVRHPGHYGSWLHLVTDLTTSSNINLYDWIGDKTSALYGHRWNNTSKKLNAIITIPSNNLINSTNSSVPAITIDGRFRNFDRITLIIKGTILGGYSSYCYNGTSGSFDVPSKSVDRGIEISSDVTEVSVKLVGAGGGGGTGNEKGNGGGGGGGGGGALVEGKIGVKPGTTVTFTAGSGGARGTTSGPRSIQDGSPGGNSIVSFTRLSDGQGGFWSAGGGGGGKGGGRNEDECDGCMSVDNSGGAGGKFTKSGPNDGSPSVSQGGAGGRGDRGSNDKSNGSGGKGGNSGSGASGGAGGGPRDDFGSKGVEPGGGGGGGGFNDRKGGERNNSGGDGAHGSYSFTYSVVRLAGTGILIQNFLGYLKIDSDGGKVAGYPSITGNPTEWGTKPVQVEAPRPATSTCT